MRLVNDTVRVLGLALSIAALTASEASAGVNGWTSDGPNAPTVANLAIARSDPAVLYLAAGSGFFKSSDGGATWAPLPNPGSGAASISVDPRSPSTLYALAGGIYRSDDGGATWLERDHGFINQYISGLCINSSGPPALYASSEGIYKSTDGGANWTRAASAGQLGVSNGYIASVFCHPNSASTVYATAYANYDSGAELWQSSDSGTSWSRLNLAAGQINFRYDVLSVVGDPNSGDIVYAIANVGLFKTTDGGKTWVNRYNGPLGFTSTLAIDPANSSRLYLGKSGSQTSGPGQPQSGLLLSTDGGASWTPLGNGLPEAGISSMVIDPTHSSLCVGTGHGIFRSTDFGSNWSGPALVPTGAYVQTLGAVPQQRVLFAGTNQGLFRTADGGKSWAASGLAGLLIKAIVADPQTPSRMFAATGSGIFKTTDSGKSWSAASAGLGAFPEQDAPVTTLAIDPKTPTTLYTFESTSWKFYKTTDGANSWTSTSLDEDVYALTVDPIDPSVIYAGRYGDFDYGKDVLIKSIDGAKSWTQAQTGLPFPGAVNAVAIDPQNHSLLYAGTSDGVFRSTDAAATWTATGTAEGLQYVSSLAIDPRKPTNIYAGTFDHGVFRSADGGATWTPFNSGLMNLGVTSLSVDSTGHVVYAATAGAGVFSYEFPAGAVDLTVGSDEATRLLSIDPQTAGLSLDRVDNAGAVSRMGTFGPFSGWVARATAGLGPTRILWTHDSGSTGLSLLSDTEITGTFRYPAIAGLSAIDVAASGPNAHILWTGSDRTAVLQRIDASGNVTKTLSFGPYAGWQATAISDGPDGLTRILWNKDDGTAGISVVSSDGSLTTVRYGPASGWTALDLAVGGDGLTRVLWSSSDGRVVLGILDATARLIRFGDIRTSPAGLSPTRVASGPNGSSRILFTGTVDSRLWIMTADGTFQNEIVLTPGSGGNITKRFDLQHE